MLVFGIALGRPTAAISRILKLFQSALCGNFVHCFADAAKVLEKTNVSNDKLGFGDREAV